LCIIIYKKLLATLYFILGAAINHSILTEARGLLKPVEERTEEGGEEPVYAEVHGEDPDAIQVVGGMPASQEGMVPPAKPRRLGWIRRGPKTYQLRSVAEEKIIPEVASVEV
jgi:hypothetical protein